VFGAITARVEESPAIIVAETLRWSGLRKSLHDSQHSAEDRVILGRNPESIFRCQQARMEKEIERVHVVVQRLLEVDAIRPDLVLCFFDQDFPSGFLPARGGCDLRIQDAEKEDCGGFADQVGVRREVSRKVALDIPSMQSQQRKQFRTKIGVPGRTGEQLVHPNPGQASERHFQRTAPVDPKRIRIRLYPAMPLREDLADIFFVAAEQPCFR